VTLRFSSILPVWILVVIGIILLALISPHTSYFQWLTIDLAAATLVTFAIQLALPSKEGLVTRMILSLGGSVLLIAVASVVLLPLTA
jgi:hypothetical protein